MKIVCVYKSGGDYDRRYVAALAAALIHHCPVDYDFYCLTNQPKEVEEFANVIELKHDLPGWWSKIELFDPALTVLNEGTVLYFDLDVLPLKNIGELTRVCLEAEWPLMLRSIDPLGIKNNWPSSSIMSWKDGSMKEVYHAFFHSNYDVIERTKSNPISRAGQRTDQGFIRTIIDANKFQDYLPNEYFVFKLDHICNPKAFKKCSILNWTGRPRFHNMGFSHAEIKTIWNDRHINYELIKDYEN